MSATANDTKMKTGFWSRGKWWKAPLLLLMLVVVIVMGNRVWADFRVTQARQAVNDLGYPITPEQLSAWYSQEHEENAAALYQQAFAMYQEDAELADAIPTMHDRSRYDDTAPQWPAMGEALPSEMRHAMASLLDLNEAHLKTIASATRVRTCRFDLDFTNTVRGLSKQLQGLRQAGRLLELQAYRAAERGDTESASQAVVTMLGLSRATREEPFTVNQLIGVSLVTLALSTLERVNARIELTDSQFAEIDAALSDFDVKPMIATALVGEMVLADQRMRDLGQDFEPAFGYGAYWLGYAQRNHVALLDYYTTGLERAPALAWPVAPFHEYADQFSYSYGLMRSFSTPQRVSMWAFFSAAAHVRCARVAIAAKRYHLEHGEWPQDCEALVAAFPELPVTDVFNPPHPIQLKQEPFGVLVYSVGRDERDDGGLRYNMRGDQFRDGSDVVALAFTTPGSRSRGCRCRTGRSDPLAYALLRRVLPAGYWGDDQCLLGRVGAHNPRKIGDL